MKIAIASDHGGFQLKQTVKKYLDAQGYVYEDLGTDSEESVDYPLYGQKAAKAVASGEYDRGILLCGTGIGISIAANKVPGIRCALAVTPFMAEMARKHNNANMLALGGRVIDDETAIEIVKMWLITDFEGGRHQKRVDMLEEI